MSNELLNLLNDIMYNNDGNLDKYLSIVTSKMHLFAYCELDKYEERLKNEIKDYTIYWIFGTSKRRITHLKSYGLNRYILHIYNYETGITQCVDFTLDNIFPPSFASIFTKITIKIVSNGFYISFLIPESCINCISEPDFINLIKIHFNKGNDGFSLELSVYQLIRVLELDTHEQLDLLYIGKSNSKKNKYNIFSRLKSHSTISKIERDRILSNPGKETLIMITSFQSKMFLKAQKNFGLILGESKWENYELIKNVHEKQEMILLLEAILINYFKPSYNKEYIEELGSDYKIYNGFKAEQVNPIKVLLNLSYEKEMLQLKTKSTYTNSEIIQIECEMQSNQLLVSGYNYPDEVCKLFK